MIALKEGVRLHGIRAEIVLALVIADGIYESENESLVVTSVIDGVHMHASIHYTGGAVDIRTPQANVDRIAQRIMTAIGDDFDVVVEGNHIHIEWQPKEPYS